MKKILIFLLALLLISCVGRLNIEQHNNYAYQMIKQNLYKEALFYLKKAEKNDKLTDNEKVKIYNNIAICYEALEKENKAKNYYKKALKIQETKITKENYENFKKDK